MSASKAPDDDMTARIAGRGLFAEALSSLGNPRIAVIGDLMLDRSVYVAIRPEILHQGPSSSIPVYDAELNADGWPRDHEAPGGTGATARCLRAFGATPIVFGVVGKDGEAESVRSHLQESGIEGRLIEDSSRPTTTKNRFYLGGSGQRQSRYEEVFRYDRELNNPLSPEVSARLSAQIIDIEDVDGVIIGDFNKGTVTAEVAAAARKLADKCDCLIIADSKPPIPYSSMKIDVLKISWDQAVSMLTWPTTFTLDRLPDDWPEHVDRLLRELAEKFHQCTVIIVTLDEHGSVVAYRDEEIHGRFDVNHLGPLKGVSLGNPLGLGDSFDAVLAMCMADGTERDARSLWRAAYVAGCISGLHVQNRPYEMVSLAQAQQALLEPQKLDDKFWPAIINPATTRELQLEEEVSVQQALERLKTGLVRNDATTDLVGYVAFDERARDELTAFLEHLREERNPSQDHPLCILIKGPPRIGKSSFIEPLAAFLDQDLLPVVECARVDSLPSEVQDRLGDNCLVFLDELHEGSKRLHTGLRVPTSTEANKKTTFIGAVSATDERLEELRADEDLWKRFGPDLWFRMRSLQERRGDIPFIFLNCLDEHMKSSGRTAPRRITPKATELLVRCCTDREVSLISDLAAHVARTIGDSDKITASLLCEFRALPVKDAKFQTDDQETWKIT